MRDFSAANIVAVPDGAPPVRHACSDTSKTVSVESSPLAIASATTSIVINLASEAGGTGSFSARENRTVPVSASTSRICFALVSNATGGVWAAAAPANNAARPNATESIFKRMGNSGLPLGIAASSEWYNAPDYLSEPDLPWRFAWARMDSGVSGLVSTMIASNGDLASLTRTST
ncbi:hypothetical protein D3C72_1430360 [compost metagenome]